MDNYEGLIKYDKLVRDNIPEIIEAKGTICKYHVASDREYWDKLIMKLAEELGEFFERPCTEELADIVEVINAIADFKFGGVNEIERVRRDKATERGGFEKRLILDETDNR